MTKFAYEFIEIPDRLKKPRDKGLTLVRDPGMGLTEQGMFLENSSEFVDYVKLRNVVPRLFREAFIKEKIDLYRKYDVKMMSGGMFFQFAWLQNKLNSYFPYVAEMGFNAAEVSRSMVEEIPEHDIIQAIRELRNLKLEVFYEWGSKYPDKGLDIHIAVEEFKNLIGLGVDRIVIEAGELVLWLNSQDRMSIEKALEYLNKSIGFEKLIFEVDHLTHIAVLLNTIGNDVNIGPNLGPSQVLWLEPMRRGLGRDVKYTALKKWRKNNTGT